MRVNDLPARFDNALAPLIESNQAAIGLAVSGGGDSLSLMHFAARSELIDNSQLIAFTVDHQLRAASADEAAFVKDEARRLGIAHRTLKWRSPNSSQARARDARHRLIADAAREAGAQILLTGHTQSDNLESFLIRARAGSGWYGLSGMGALTASPVWPEGEGVFIARPLLGLDRGEIREWLEGEGAAWCEDPGNENDAYERVRMRRLLGDAPHLSSRIARLQDKLRQLRSARDRQLADILKRTEIADQSLALTMATEIDSGALAQCLAMCTMVVAGSDRPARTARCVAASERLIETGAGDVTLTLGGAVIRKSGQTLHFMRESNRPGTPDPAELRSRLRHIGAGLTGAVPAYS